MARPDSQTPFHAALSGPWPARSTERPARKHLLQHPSNTPSVLSVVVSLQQLSAVHSLPQPVCYRSKYVLLRPASLRSSVCRWRIHALTSDCPPRYRRTRPMRTAPFSVNGRARSPRGATPTTCSARSHVLRRPGPPCIRTVAWTVPEAQGSLPPRRHARLARTRSTC